MANEQNQNTQNTSSTGNFSGGREGGVGGGAASARGLVEQAKETAGQAYSAATDKAASTLEERKSDLAVGLTSVADTLRQVSGNLSTTDQPNKVTDLTSRYGDQIARRIDDISNYFERKNVREMVRDVESFARRNPAVFIGTAFAAGLLAARFLKSSPEGGMSRGDFDTGRLGAGTPDQLGTTDYTSSEFGTTSDTNLTGDFGKPGKLL